MAQSVESPAQSAAQKLEAWFQTLSPEEQQVVIELIRTGLTQAEIEGYAASPFLLALARTSLVILALGGAAAVPGRALAAPGPAPHVAAAISLEDDATRLAAAINDQRAAAGVPALAVNPRLNDLAQQRSQDQVDRRYFSHTTPDGQTIFDLLGSAGIDYRVAGENLAESRGLDPVVAAIDGFLQSAPHRANLLDPNFGHVGIGAARGPDGTTILTVVFTD